MTPAEQRVRELVDKWLKSLELHLRYASLDDEAYWRVQPWVPHQRPARWILELAHARASDLNHQLQARGAAGDTGFAEAVELMAFLSSLVGVQPIERFVPLADPAHENPAAFACVEADEAAGTPVARELPPEALSPDDGDAATCAGTDAAAMAQVDAAADSDAEAAEAAAAAAAEAAEAAEAEAADDAAAEHEAAAELDEIAPAGSQVDAEAEFEVEVEVDVVTEGAAVAAVGAVDDGAGDDASDGGEAIEIEAAQIEDADEAPDEIADEHDEGIAVDVAELEAVHGQAASDPEPASAVDAHLPMPSIPAGITTPGFARFAMPTLTMTVTINPVVAAYTGPAWPAAPATPAVPAPVPAPPMAAVSPDAVAETPTTAAHTSAPDAPPASGLVATSTSPPAVVVVELPPSPPPLHTAGAEASQPSAVGTAPAGTSPSAHGGAAGSGPDPAMHEGPATVVAAPPSTWTLPAPAAARHASSAAPTVTTMATVATVATVATANDAPALAPAPTAPRVALPPPLPHVGSPPLTLAALEARIATPRSPARQTNSPAARSPPPSPPAPAPASVPAPTLAPSPGPAPSPASSSSPSPLPTVHAARPTSVWVTGSATAPAIASPPVVARSAAPATAPTAVPSAGASTGVQIAVRAPSGAGSVAGLDATAATVATPVLATRPDTPPWNDDTRRTVALRASFTPPGDGPRVAGIPVLDVPRLTPGKGRKDGKAAKGAAREADANATPDELVIADAVRLLKWGKEWHELAEAIARMAGRPAVGEVRKMLRTHKADIQKQARH